MQEQLSVLLVDDDAVDRMAVRRALRAADRNLALDEVSDSAAALVRLEQAPVDCLLLDYQLPGTDGLAVLRDLRERGITTPVVMLTGQGDEQLAVEIMKAGAADYITKGELAPERLIQSIRTAVRLHRAELQAAQAERALRESVERLWFLAEASRVLSTQLDSDAILDNLVRLTVPWLADWCAVDIVDAEGAVSRLTTVVREGTDDDSARELDALFALDPTAVCGPAVVLTSGKPQAHPPLPGARSYAADASWDARLVALGVVSAISVPMTVRGRVLGVLTLAAIGARRPFVEDDLHLATDLGQRAAVALDNAALVRAAQEAVLLRDAFLATASHELKTPLTSLFGNAQLLERRTRRDGGLSEREQRVVRVIVEQAARLDKMIGSLLDISRLRTGQLDIERAPLDLHELARRLAEEMQSALNGHQLALHGPDEPLIILGDELRLHQVFQNLLSNAIKYSPAGGIIEVRVERHGSWATVAISDEGIGIPSDALPNLFQQFYRAANVSERHIGGIGLGLYVVREIVTLHDGTVDVESVEGKGSTFTVRLPALTLAAPPVDDAHVTMAPALR